MAMIAAGGPTQTAHTSQRANSRPQSAALGSIARYATSLGQVRSASVAIVEATAGDSLGTKVHTGALQGAPVTQTQLTDIHTLWGSVDASALTLAQLEISEGLYLPLTKGKRYLLFLTPASLDPAPGVYSPTMGVAYEALADGYMLVGDPGDALPREVARDERDRFVSGT